MTWEFEPKIVLPTDEHRIHWTLFPIPTGVWGKLAPETVSSADLPLIGYLEIPSGLPGWLAWSVTKTGTGSLPLLVTVLPDRS